MAEVNEAKREKSQVEDINRSLYDFRYEEKDAYKVDAGLTPAIVEQISREKNDPDWMLELRLKSLELKHGQHRDLRPCQHKDERGLVRGPGGDQGYL